MWPATPSSRSAAAITLKPALLEPEPEPGLVLDGAARDAGEALLDRLDGVLGGEQLLDVGFTGGAAARALV